MCLFFEFSTTILKNNSIGIFLKLFYCTGLTMKTIQTFETMKFFKWPKSAIDIPMCPSLVVHIKCATKSAQKKGQRKDVYRREYSHTWVWYDWGEIDPSISSLTPCAQKGKKKKRFLGSSLNRFQGNLSMRFIDLFWLRVVSSVPLQVGFH